MPTNRKAPQSNPAADPEGLKLHDSKKLDDREFQLLTDDLRLAGFFKATLQAGASVALDDVLEYLHDLGITVDDTTASLISDAIENADAGLVGPLLVAEGSPPVNGIDGSIEWHVRRPDEVAARKASAGRVDYRERNTIINVSQGLKILSLVAPTEGTPGTDIFSNNIPCQQGHAASIRRGKNVDLSEKDQCLVALASGYLEQIGDSISVEPLLVIPADVDMTVGNIDFIGPVKITKDILDGFYVRAGSNIEVGGMVEAAILEAGGSIRVNGGVAGKGKGRITCKGDFETRYLNEVYVETGGNITVSNSVINSTVKSLGSIEVLSGGIRGANVVARKGLRSPEIGSDLGVRTMVVVGVDYHVKDKLVNLEREVAVIRDAVSKIEAALGPLLSDGTVINTLPPDKAEVARRLLAQLDMLIERGNKFAEVREKMLGSMEVGDGMYVEVAKKIFAGVVMQIGTCRRTFEMDILGPVKLRPDLENGSVKVSR